MASLIQVRINKGDFPNLGFRLQGGKDFGTPLVIQKVNVGSPAERAGLVAGDSVIKINNTDVFNLRHKDAQDVVLRAGPSFEMTIQRGGSTWKPSVVPTGPLSTPSPYINSATTVTRTSLASNKSENIGAIGTGHNLSAKPFSPQVNGAVNGGPRLVNTQYNSPVKLYSEESIAETLSAQTEVLSTGALGVNFKKNEKNYDASNSEVLRALKEAENDTNYNDQEPDSGVVTTPNSGIAGLRHVQAPENKPQPPQPQLPPGQNICADCERLIVGVFVRIKDKNLHVECFKCSTCGSSLKNVGYYNINNKLYCDIHAKSAALKNQSNPNLVPVTVPPGGKAPVHAISSALSSHSYPTSSPLSPKLNTAGNQFQTNVTGPKPFSSVTAPLSPSNTLPRAAPLSPVAPAPAPSFNSHSYTPSAYSPSSAPSFNSKPRPFSLVVE
ncbi:PDZ and LIM domain protein Zasp isoform X19 [Diorhabda carinulata]|uniref:PDZ and LIM domain protein Zasp isoform X19 n=1 Tax=Diorhabda carinulata TaxID=1163345 RepID=UPI0025A15636|nr:PDZ and LIM domain protein Zasp isoform X19 [Diorhabda carinulata]